MCIVFSSQPQGFPVQKQIASDSKSRGVQKKAAFKSKPVNQPCSPIRAVNKVYGLAITG